MCGRFQVEIEEKELREIIRDADGNYHIKDMDIHTGEIRPTNIATVLAVVDGEIQAMPMFWGLPKWWGDKGVIFNVKAETALQNKRFREPLLQHPTIIITTGFFEWKAKEGKKKKDMYIFKDPNSKITYLAGFNNTYDGEDRFTILTREPNKSVEDYHDRMPIVVPKDDIKEWLSGEKIQYYLDRVPDALDVEMHREAAS